MAEKKITADSEHEHNLMSLLKHRIAGDPDDRAIVYTDLSPTQLSARMKQLGTPVSSAPIRGWMADHKLRLRRIQKVLSCGQTRHRDAQFQRITELIEHYRTTGNPCFSVDSKAREFLGQLYRQGRVRCTQSFQAFDHDFPSLAAGVILID